MELLTITPKENAIKYFEANKSRFKVIGREKSFIEISRLYATVTTDDEREYVNFLMKQIKIKL